MVASVFFVARGGGNIVVLLKTPRGEEDKCKGGHSLRQDSGEPLPC